MKIQYMGHSCFHMITQSKTAILTDPYKDRGSSSVPTLRADIILSSHSHCDHSFFSMASGPAHIITGAGSHRIDGVSIAGHTADHGTLDGKWLGMVVCYSIEADGLKFLHLSDIGVMPSPAEIEEFGTPDVLFVPVGGHFTLDPEKAAELTHRINPAVVIPMHYAVPGTDRIRNPVEGPEKFLSFFKSVNRLRDNTVEITVENLPDPLQVWVLNPSF